MDSKVKYPPPKLGKAEWLTTDEVAELLDLSNVSVRKLVHKKEIPFSKIGRSFKFHKPAIDKWLEIQSSAPDNWEPDD